MTFAANVVKVLVASPGDTIEERKAVEDAIAGWNASLGENRRVIFMPWLWEKHAVPELGEDGQSVINQQAVESSDVVIAIFDSRLGMATPRSVSGTAEEITQASQAGKPVHVWFSNEPLRRDVDPNQLAAMNLFRQELENRGLLGVYANPSDLAYQVRMSLDHDVLKLKLGDPEVHRPSGAQIRSRYKHEKFQSGADRKTGVPKFSTHNRLVVRNEGGATAEQLTIEVIAPIAGAQFQWGSSKPDRPFDLLPKAEREWVFIPLAGDSVIVRSSWNEGGRRHTEDQEISL